MKRLFAILLLLVSLFCLCSCKKKQEDPPAETIYSVEFSVTLLPYAAVVPGTQSVKAGEKATEPAVSVTPSAGYVVIWTADPSARTPYDFNAAVEKDLLLYAVETPRAYRVTYLTERGTVPASNPTSFTKETETFALKAVTLDQLGADFGYEFLNWSYYDDPDSIVNEIPKGTEGDVILRAKISPIRYDVYYKECDLASDTYLYGETKALPTPEREGSEFLGWTIYMDGAHTPVTALTPAFVKGNWMALFHGNGSGIGLEANWREKE